MKKLKIYNSFFIGLVMVFIISLGSSTVNAAPKQKRLAGADRFKTSSAVVEDGWKRCDNAILVNGENYPDSLSAAVLAKKYNAPLILTRSNSLEENAKKQLQRLKTKHVYIVGGQGVIKANVEEELTKLNMTTERISGKDRYATSVAIAEKIGIKNGVILATGNDYTDALSIAPIAAKLQIPILLIPKDNVPQTTADFMKGKTVSKTYIIGSTSIISDKVASTFRNVQRISGKDKYERNINIIKTFEDNLDFSNAIMAYSEGFADALSGTAYAAIKIILLFLLGKIQQKQQKDILQIKI
ncbi:cell wall-binding repeat-containing protein [Clostridium tetanomorphum]|uniref:cell wall-binding repeat-containing protein n=1 Tax=Clostridium tetanomorphum TaxID=1553 RepID=UPI000D992D05|nr:cell wall-binding repeat-containing protein [Clostridium tetanomorphum]SQC02490.1 cell wall-binding protein [Clostridium tetanomorphum]